MGSSSTDLLDRLVGRWSLHGKMGDVSLFQDVVGRWVLRGLFVEMRLSPVRVGESGNPDYEAMYFIGHDKKKDEYILHLFDTYGVSSKPVPGVGNREGNSIRFKFDYEGGPWFNTFTWLPERKAWKNVITYDQQGKEATFAEKNLEPVP